MQNRIKLLQNIVKMQATGASRVPKSHLIQLQPKYFIDSHNKSKKWARPEPVPEPLNYQENVDQQWLLQEISALKELHILDVRDSHERELYGAIGLPEEHGVTVRELPLDEL